MLAKVRSAYRNTSAVVIMAVDDVEIAAETMKLSALDYIVKPFELDRVNTSIRRLIELNQASFERADGQTTRGRLIQ